MVEERLYIVTYDITDDRRWRRVFKLMHGYGRWLQLSVFQCRLSAYRRAEMARRLEEVIHDAAEEVQTAQHSGSCDHASFVPRPHFRGIRAAASLKRALFLPIV